MAATEGQETSRAMERHLDPGEKFFWLVDPVATMNFLVHVECTIPLEPTAVQSALERLQRSDALARVAIRAEAGEVRFVPTDRPIPLETIEVAAADWRLPLEQALARRFAAETGPLLAAVLVRIRDQPRCVLALVFHHSIADGRSGAGFTLRLLRDLLDGVAPPPDGATLPPPMHALFPERFQWAGQPAAMAEVVLERKTAFKRHGRTTPLPWLGGTQPATPRFVSLTLEPPVVVALLDRARAAGATLHGAVGAALLLAASGLVEIDDPVLILSSPVDLRPSLTAPTGDGLGLHISFLSSTYRVKALPFWDLARGITTDLREQIGRGQAHLFHHAMALDRIAATPASIEAFAGRLFAMPHDLMLSNIGAVDPQGLAPRLHALGFALCPMPYQGVFCAVASLAGRMTINLVYDEARLLPEAAADLATTLGVRLGAEAG